MLDMLVSAVLASFGNARAGQLARFARRFVGEKVGLLVESERSPTAQAVRFARELVESGKLSDDFFDTWQKRVSPEYADIVGRARQVWHDEQSASSEAAPVVSLREGVASSPEPAPPKAPARDNDPWLDELDAALDEAATAPSQPPQEAIDAAALLPSFDPRALNRVLDGTADAGTADALVAMAPLVEHGPEGGMAPETGGAA